MYEISDSFLLFKVNVQPGDTVKKGDVLMVMEAMKMEVIYYPYSLSDPHM